MRYDIEPIRLTGANILGRTYAEPSGLNLTNVEKADLEKVLRSMPSLSGFALKARLPISFQAKVLRNLHPRREVVRLSSKDKVIDLFRDVSGNPGDIGVSCSPNGVEAPVQTLNIRFRDYEDSLTDRGLVWVRPGNPAVMNFVIRAQALETPGTIREIVVAAEKVVEEKVLSHFQG